MGGDIPSLPNTPSWRGAQLKHRDNFTFNFIGLLCIKNTSNFMILVRNWLTISKIIYK
jgi:hypothetical protein